MRSTAQEFPRPVSSYIDLINSGVIGLLRTDLSDLTPNQLVWARANCAKLQRYLYPTEKGS